MLSVFPEETSEEYSDEEKRRVKEEWIWSGPPILWVDPGYPGWWDADYVIFRASKAKEFAQFKARTPGSF